MVQNEIMVVSFADSDLRVIRINSLSNLMGLPEIERRAFYIAESSDWDQPIVNGRKTVGVDGHPVSADCGLSLPRQVEV